MNAQMRAVSAVGIVTMAIVVAALDATSRPAGADTPPSASPGSAQEPDAPASCPYTGITAADLAHAALRESDLPGYNRQNETSAGCVIGGPDTEFPGFVTLAGYRVEWETEVAASPSMIWTIV